MTALKLFSIAANGTDMGVFKAADADAAVLAYVKDAGYETIADAADALGESVEDFRADLAVEDLQETYEYLLEDIRDYAAEESDSIEEILNRHREELSKIAGKLSVDYSADLEKALAGTFYRDTVYQETAMILSVTNIDTLGLLRAA
ncbi:MULTISPECIES: hypothetical protein [Rhizobium]|uniref:hypothetical protein n=1 Tax=Rhizobium TaxID=379 RepID=UPI00041C7C53|nr:MULTISPECIES: hypothetical protein [Rhizobium]UFS81578.1 hypothetical protein LPB79_25230 [Rhizobium sp. T136]